MSERFRIEKVDKGSHPTFHLHGFIDEDTNFSPLLAEKGSLYVNFSNVKGINSCGIRTWVNFLKEYGNRPIFFEECPPLIVRQINMVPSFSGKAEITSVFVPYYCESCEFEKNVLFSKDHWAAKEVQIPSNMPCENCQKGEMELDGNPQQYFAFRR